MYDEHYNSINMFPTNSEKDQWQQNKNKKGKITYLNWNHLPECSVGGGTIVWASHSQRHIATQIFEEKGHGGAAYP